MTPMGTVNRPVAAVWPGMVLVAAIAAFALCEAVTGAKETGR